MVSARDRSRVPNAGSHGGDGAAVAAGLGMNPWEILDLSASLNPFAPDIRSRVRLLVDGDVLRRYPDDSPATLRLAKALGCDAGQVVLTNGCAEAISLVAALLGRGWVAQPEFSLYEEHLRAMGQGALDPNGPLFRSNPNNPTGLLATPEETAEVWDEAFYPLATGSWTRGDAAKGSFVVGSLTKLFACPGLRIGYVVAPDPEIAASLRERRPRWSVGSIAAGLLPDLLDGCDLPEWARQIAAARGELASVLDSHGLDPRPSDANWLLFSGPADLRESLAAEGILVRDCTGFGLAGIYRMAVPDPRELERIDRSLSRALGGSADREVGSGSRSSAGVRGIAAPGARPAVRGALMVCGTGSDAGKSAFVTGLCRLLARSGVRVAPFKGQNMSLNSFVTPGGAEIGRAQAVQAFASGVEPVAEMNPVLLKPTGERASQVVVMGRPWADMDAGEYQRAKARLRPIVESALDSLLARHDVVVLEGAGSPAEINLLDSDIANLGLAASRQIAAMVVGDIERGGVLASIYGTMAILPPELGDMLRGFVVNKFRGDPALLVPGVEALARRSGLTPLGTIPWCEQLAFDAEDSLTLASGLARPAVTKSALSSPALDVAAIALPHLSNATDLDPLALEPALSLRLVHTPAEIADADLVVIPGTKATLYDLAWLRDTGLAAAVVERARRPGGPVVLGICGGYQMLGTHVEDGVESPGRAEGLGLLDVETVFRQEKVTRQRSGALAPGVFGAAHKAAVAGYEIHHGQVARHSSAATAWIALDDEHGSELEGAADWGSGVLGTSLHGMLECDELRSLLLTHVASRRSKGFDGCRIRFAECRNSRIDALADLIEAHCDVDGILALAEARGASSPASAGGRRHL